MPQLDLDILEDFLFFAFAALLLGFGDDDIEEHAVERHADAHLAHHFLATAKELRAEASLVARAAARLLLFLFSFVTPFSVRTYCSCSLF